MHTEMPYGHWIPDCLHEIVDASSQVSNCCSTQAGATPGTHSGDVFLGLLLLACCCIINQNLSNSLIMQMTLAIPASTEYGCACVCKQRVPYSTAWKFLLCLVDVEPLQGRSMPFQCLVYTLQQPCLNLWPFGSRARTSRHAGCP